MNAEDFLHEARKLSQPFSVTDGQQFQLSQIDPGDTLDIIQKQQAKQILSEGVKQLAHYQEMLYAQDRWTVLLIFQAMDAAGKDSAIKHVMSGVNPQGCEVYSFKVPSEEDLDHDYLWRCVKRLPERGRIGIFNRSYYEETIVVRVHREFLERQKLPAALISENIWNERFQDIRSFESYVSRNGVAIRKFFLHVSKAEQKKRFLKRIDDPEKNWKFSVRDVSEREHWDEYMSAYEETVRHTASDEAPWYVIPADHKWFTRLVVSSAVVDCMASLNLAYPKLRAEEQNELMEAKALLLSTD
jgi:PPK2 family polyphosphate:nucleotide phosphotransferase